MTKSIIGSIGIIVAIGLIVFVLVSLTNDTPDTKQNTSALALFGDIELKDYDGNTVTLDDFKRRPLVVNSWAVWCPFCVKELADFAELQKEFGDRIVVIAIDRQEPLEKVKGFTDGLGITNDVLFLLDRPDTFYKSIGGFSMPETLFINVDGEIVVHKRGPMDLEEMRTHVEKIILK